MKFFLGMKKRGLKSIIILVSILTILSGCKSEKLNDSSAEKSLGTVKIQYNLSNIPKLGSNQVAVWIEDTKGNYICTLYATEFTASGGYAQRPEALPQWFKKSNWKNAKKSEVDAVSSATKKPGTINITWDCKDNNKKNVKPGKYVYFIEGNIYWDNTVLWRGEIQVGNNENKSMAKAEYQPESAKNQGTLIENVSAVYTPNK